MGKNQVEQLRADVVQTMTRYEEQLRAAGMNVEADQIAQKTEEFLQGLFQVLFTGVFSAGKSTTLNALMSQKLLFVSINPATPVITRIINGENSSLATVTYRDPDRPDEQMELQEVKERFRLDVEDSEKFREIKYVTLQRELPSETVIFVDSPGLEHNDTDSAVANEFAEKADAIVFVLHATSAMKQSERKYIADRFAGRQLRNVFFVVNWYNMVQPQEEDVLKEKIRFDLQDVFMDAQGSFDEELYASRVFYVDAFTSECARTGTPKVRRKGAKTIEEAVPPEEDAYTGIPELEDALYAFLRSSDKDKDAYNGYLPRMAAMYKSTDQHIQETKEAAAADLAELEKRRAKMEKAVRELSNTVEAIRRSFTNTVNEIMVNVDREYTFFLTDVSNNWDSHFQDCEVDFGGLDMAKIAYLKAKYRVQDWMGGNDQQYSDEQLKFMREESIQKLMEPISKKIQEYVEGKAEEMSRQIAADSDSALNRLEGDIRTYSKTIQDMNVDGIDIRQIVMNMVPQGMLEGKELSGDFDLAQVMLTVMVFGNLDEATKRIATGKQSWGSFLKETLMTEMMEIILIFLVEILTGWGLLYYICRAIWGAFRIHRNGSRIGRDMLMNAKESTVQRLQDERDAFGAEMQRKFADRLNKGCRDFCKNFNAQLKQKQDQLNALIKRLTQEGFDSEAEGKRLDGIQAEMTAIFNELAGLVSGRGFTREQILDFAANKPEM